MGDYTDLLYARPSFLEGMGCALDLGATLNEYKRSLNAARANYHALRSDFAAVNQDLWWAWQQAEQDIPSRSSSDHDPS